MTDARVEKLYAAHRFLAGLKLGESVVVTMDGQDRQITVQEQLDRPLSVGSWDNDSRVKVGYGPGRWNTEVSASRVADGYIKIRRADEGTTDE